MKIRLEVAFVDSPAPEVLARIERLEKNIISQLEKIMSALSDLQTAVAAENTVIDSAVTLLQGLKTALDAAGTDPVALKALSDDITAKTNSLSAAIVANTPVTPPPAA